jgi:4-amino-4-deoxy-L-arabinose transferase-like glycosyltransferase
VRPTPSARPRVWERPWLALAALLVLAAALRLPGLRYGLPFPLLNPDEASIVPRAWELVHGGGLDPGWYDYPSLLFTVLAPLQAFADTPSYAAARAGAAFLGIAGVVAPWWLGRVAYGPLAGIVAGAAVAVATVHVAYSHVAVTDVLLTTLVTISLALAVQGRLEWAAAAAGLAASAKYPGVFLAVPLLAVGWRQWRRLASGAGLALLAFVLTSPFVVWHAGAAWDDISRVQRLAAEGWLGFERDHPTPIAFLDRLWESLGPALAVGLAGLALALGELVFIQHKLFGSRRDFAQPGRSFGPRKTLVLNEHKRFGLRRASAWPTRLLGERKALVRNEHKVSARRADLALAVFALAYFAYLLTLDAHFDRYVLPLVPVLATFAGRVRPLGALTLVLLLVPLAWSIGDVRELTRTDTRVVAHAWIETNVPAKARVAVESSTPPLGDRTALRLELPGPGRSTDADRDVERLRELGIEYVLVTGAVADRVLAASDRYPTEARFYADLETGSRRVLRVAPGGERAGPWVALYRL